MSSAVRGGRLSGARDGSSVDPQARRLAARDDLATYRKSPLEGQRGETVVSLLRKCRYRKA